MTLQPIILQALMLCFGFLSRDANVGLSPDPPLVKIFTYIHGSQMMNDNDFGPLTFTREYKSDLLSLL